VGRDKAAARRPRRRVAQVRRRRLELVTCVLDADVRGSRDGHLRIFKRLRA